MNTAKSQSPGNAGGMLTKLKGFFDPLFNRRVLIRIIVCGLLLAAVFTFVDVRIAGLRQRNALEALFLASELKTEAGPDFKAARKMHLRLLTDQVDRMEERQPTTLIAIVRPSDSPRAHLKEARDVLENQSEAPSDIEAIRRAGEILGKVGRDWTRANSEDFPAFVARSSSQNLNTVSAHLKALTQAVNKLESTREVSLAEDACMSSRMASATLLSYWSEFNRPQNSPSLNRFQSDLARLHSEMKKLASNNGGDEQKRILAYTENVSRRAALFKALSTDGVSGGERVMLAALRSTR
jgi:hypothetical protein